MAFLDETGLATFKKCIDKNFLPAIPANNGLGYYTELKEVWYLATKNHQIYDSSSGYAPLIALCDKRGTTVSQFMHQFLSTNISATVISAISYDNANGSNPRYGTFAIYRKPNVTSDEEGTSFLLTSPSAFRQAIGISTITTSSVSGSGSPGQIAVQI